MEQHIVELNFAIKEYQKKEQISDITLALILNELLAMKLREILIHTI